MQNSYQHRAAVFAGRGALCLFALLTALLSASTEAQLQWEATEIAIEQDPDVLSMTGTFKFSNSGDYPLYIQQVVSRGYGSRAWLDEARRTVRPGGQGSVIVDIPNSLLFEERIITVHVLTDERLSPTKVLNIRLTPQGWAKMSVAERRELAAEGKRIAAIPSPVTVAMPTALWRFAAGHPPQGVKVIDVRFAGVNPAKLTDLIPVRPDAERFKTNIKELEPGRHYQVEIELSEILSDDKVQSIGPQSLHAEWRLETTLSADAKKRAELFGPLTVSARCIALPYSNTAKLP